MPFILSGPEELWHPILHNRLPIFFKTLLRKPCRLPEVQPQQILFPADPRQPIKKTCNAGKFTKLCNIVLIWSGLFGVCLHQKQEVQSECKKGVDVERDQFNKNSTFVTFGSSTSSCRSR
jgi:hypothetical protein